MRVGRYIAALGMAIGALLVVRGQAAAPTHAVHEITLPRYQPNLPPGPGREAFATCCLACHTDRYISTQPPFPAAKWEAEVHKMVKTYGAYVTDEQVPLIVKYAIFLQKSPEGTLVVPVPPAEPGPALKANAEDLAAGQALFAKDCSICHVAALHSTSQAKLALPLPADLSTIAFSNSTLSADIHNGVPGTAMPAYSFLKNQELEALMAYIQSIAPPPQHADGNAEGKQLYMTSCLSCHGPSGAGDGFAGVALPRPPADFCKEQPTADFAFRAISDGIAGTSMPPWKTKYTEQQRRELAEFVRSLYR